MSELDRLIEDLNAAASRLRSGQLEPNEAADVVERLAELAGRIGQTLEREARAPTPGEPPGQETLL